MVQDLQAVNRAIIPRAPLVPDPHTLLNDLDPKVKYFSVTDLANAFFSVPVHRDSQFCFAFQFEGEKYTYTRIPQGYCESPTIFSMTMSSNLAKFNPPRKSQLLLYVDDILIASRTEIDCNTDTLALLDFLAEQGHKVSKNKLQLWKPVVKYFGFNISQSGKHLEEKRKTAILQALKPTTKRKTMKK